jgi:hypothetical protein
VWSAAEVTAGDVVLLHAPSLAESLPGRWWVPPADVLAAVQPDRAYVKVLALERAADGSADVWAARPVWLDVEERDECGVSGTIVDSELSRAGYAEGERLAVPWTRIFDLVLLADDGEALFNVQRACFAIGKRVLVGITELSPQEDEVVGRHTFAGTVCSVDPERGIELRLDDRSSYWLPPDTSALREAPPGEYELRATGQTVVDPDYTATWTITQRETGAPGLTPDGYRPPAADGE